jgi:hypothetical protein
MVMAVAVSMPSPTRTVAAALLGAALQLLVGAQAVVADREMTVDIASGGAARVYAGLVL